MKRKHLKILVDLFMTIAMLFLMGYCNSRTFSFFSRYSL